MGDGSMPGKFYPQAKMTIPNEKPYRLEDLLKLFFGESPKNARIITAKVLLETIREEMPKGWPAENWPELVIKAMMVYYPDAEALMEYYNDIKWTEKKSRIPKLLVEKAKELGLEEEGERKARGRVVDLFTVYKGHYSVVTKILKEAGLIRKVNGYYQLSDEFERILEGIAEFWRYWRKGKAE